MSLIGITTKLGRKRGRKKSKKKKHILVQSKSIEPWGITVKCIGFMWLNCDTAQLLLDFKANDSHY